METKKKVTRSLELMGKPLKFGMVIKAFGENEVSICKY
jgi:hypothetical protein